MPISNRMWDQCSDTDRASAHARAYELRVAEQAGGADASRELAALLGQAVQKRWPNVELAVLLAQARKGLDPRQPRDRLWPRALTDVVARSARPSIQAQMVLLEVLIARGREGEASFVDDVVRAWDLLSQPDQYPLDVCFGYLNLSQALSGARLWQLAEEALDEAQRLLATTEHGHRVEAALHYCRAESRLSQVLALGEADDPDASAVLSASESVVAEALDGAAHPLWQAEIDALRAVAAAVVRSSSIAPSDIAGTLSQLQAGGSTDIALLLESATPRATWRPDLEQTPIPDGRFAASTHFVRTTSLVTAEAPATDVITALEQYGQLLGRSVLSSAATASGGLSTVIESGSAVLEHRRLQREVKTDSLTGVGNRRAFDERLSGMAGRPGTLLMTDVDFFRVINDAYGYEVGDAMLQGVAHSLREATAELTEDDAVYRLGGDRFAVVLPPCSAEQLDGLRADVTDRLAEQVAAEETGVLVPGMSFGHASGPIGTDLSVRADRAMCESRPDVRTPPRFDDDVERPPDRRQRGQRAIARTDDPVSDPDPTEQDAALLAAYALARLVPENQHVRQQISDALERAREEGWTEVWLALRRAEVVHSFGDGVADRAALTAAFLDDAIESQVPGHESIALAHRADHHHTAGEMEQYLDAVTRAGAGLHDPKIHPLALRAGLADLSNTFGRAGYWELEMRYSESAERAIAGSIGPDAPLAGTTLLNRTLRASHRGLLSLAAGLQHAAREFHREAVRNLQLLEDADVPDPWRLTVTTLAQALEFAIADTTFEKGLSAQLRSQLDAFGEREASLTVALLTAIDDASELPPADETLRHINTPVALFLRTRALERVGGSAAAVVQVRHDSITHLVGSAAFGEHTLIAGIRHGLRARHSAAERALLLQESNTDPLTGLSNRRAFEAAFAELTGDHAWLAIIDVDGLKDINAALGHAAGDERLRTAGRMVAALADPRATVARLGSDEFAILMSGQTPPDLFTQGADGLGRPGGPLTQTLCTALQDDADATGQPAANGALRVTAGVSSGTCDRQLLGDADADLYEGKRARSTVADRVRATP